MEEPRRGPKDVKIVAISLGGLSDLSVRDGPMLRSPMVSNRLLIALVLVAGLISSLGVGCRAHADLGPDFDWDDDAVRSLAVNNPGALDAASPAERARMVAGLMHGLKVAVTEEEKTGMMNLLKRTDAVQRFQVFRILDKGDETTLRRFYDKLDEPRRIVLLALCKQSGAAADQKGLQEIGIVSDIDDTAVPTQFHPDGYVHFKDAAEFYRLLDLGPDGTGEGGDLHFVSAQPRAEDPVTRLRFDAAGLPHGTIDNRPVAELFGGLDTIQKSKIDNINLWLALHPSQKFVFLGDTIQRDPEVYRDVQKNHPNQVAAVFIHQAGGKVTRSSADYPNQIPYDTYADAQRILLDRQIIGNHARPGSLGQGGT